MPSSDPVSSITNCHRLIVSYMTQYTASSSRNAQLSQLDLVFKIIVFEIMIKEEYFKYHRKILVEWFTGCPNQLGAFPRGGNIGEKYWKILVKILVEWFQPVGCSSQRWATRGAARRQIFKWPREQQNINIVCK